MKTLTLIAATLGMAFAGPALAQTMTQQQIMPNGAVRTTTVHQGPMGGVHATTRVDRPDGSTRVIRRDTGPMGRTRVVAHDDRRGWNLGRRVCNVRWRHGHRERHCWMRR